MLRTSCLNYSYKINMPEPCSSKEQGKKLETETANTDLNITEEQEKKQETEIAKKKQETEIANTDLKS